MYIIIRPKTEDKKEAVCLVQASSITGAKDMAGIAETSTTWVSITNGLMSGFADIKEGMIVREL